MKLSGAIDKLNNKSKDTIIVIMVAVLAILVVIGSAFFYEEPIRKFEETRTMMDTFVTITVYCGNEETAQVAITAAYERMEEVIAITSIWNETAEAYQLNLNSEITNPSEELIELIETSIYFSEVTDGSFDITVKPLLDLWEYKPEAESQFWELDSTVQLEIINETMPRIGSDMIEINTSPSTIRFTKEGMSITTGGIAKGYVVDEGLKILENMRIEYALINAGGDLATIGSKPDSSWTVALENPENENEFITRFKISGKSVATSGNYRRYYNESEKVGHILNPKTGYSANECWSVAIIADNCTYADVLATGVFVMGPNDGMQLIDSLEGVECLIIDSESKISRSQGLSEFEY